VKEPFKVQDSTIQLADGIKGSELLKAVQQKELFNTN